MRIIQEKTIYQLTFFPRVFPVNCYLVEEEDGLTLVDAAIPSSWKGILQAASQIGKPITSMILTHGHMDHVGALDALKEILPDVPVYISKRDARLLTGDRSLLPNEPSTPIRGGVPKKVTTRADVCLENGNQIGSLIALSTPGHTPGSMSFLDTRTNGMIVGDALQTRGGVAIAGQIRPWFPFPALATWHKETALESARKIRGYNPSFLGTGHGDLLMEPLNALNGAIKDAEKNLLKNSQLT